MSSLLWYTVLFTVNYRGISRGILWRFNQGHNRLPFKKGGKDRVLNLWKLPTHRRRRKTGEYDLLQNHFSVLSRALFSVVWRPGKINRDRICVWKPIERSLIQRHFQPAEYRAFWCEENNHGKIQWIYQRQCAVSLQALYSAPLLSGITPCRVVCFKVFHHACISSSWMSCEMHPCSRDTYYHWRRDYERDLVLQVRMGQDTKGV